MARRNRPDPFSASALRVLKSLHPDKQEEVRSQAARFVESLATAANGRSHLRALASAMVVASAAVGVEDDAIEAEAGRLVGLGCTRSEVALILGCTPGRITDLLGSPVEGLGRPGHPRRGEAVALLQDGNGVSAVARHIGVARSTVYAWRAELNR